MRAEFEGNISSGGWQKSVIFVNFAMYMKILFIGDYSNIHVTLAREFRRRGHEVTVASAGSGCMDTERDIDLTRKGSIFGAFAYLGRLMRFMEKAKGYDVVQLVNPGFFALRPGKLRYFFNELKRHNRSIFLSIAGDDPVIVKGNCIDHPLPYSEMRIGSEKTPFAKRYPYYEQKWMSGPNGDYCRHVYENIDGAMSALYEYHILAAPYLGDKLTYTGIPIDTYRFSPGEGFNGIEKKEGEKLNIAVAIKSDYEMFKGLDRLYKVALRVESMNPDSCEVNIIRDLPYEDYVKAIEKADVVVDQLYSMSPATNGLETMARGQITISGGERDYYSFLGEDLSEGPVLNLSPLMTDEEMTARLCELVTDKELVRRLSAAGPEFVRRNNDVRIVANRYMEMWKKMLKDKDQQ